MMIDFWTAFAQMQDAGVFVWPTPKSNANFISSTFGMRIRRSGNCNDFHRGVDIHGNIGDPVVASYHGIVIRVMEFSGGNKVIIMEHKFLDNMFVRFHDKRISKWYTLYLHLHQQLVIEGQVVQAGDLIGTLGDSGVHVLGGPHLHHEVRLGTRCSMEYILTHPKKGNNNNNNNKNKKQNHIVVVDPHVHPFYIYPRRLLGIPSITMTLKEDATTMDGRQVLIETTDTCPNMNRFQVQIFYKNENMNNTVIINDNEETLLSTTSNSNRSHVLDYNHRLGFNPTTTIELDTVDTSKPYLQPIPFGYKATQWRIKLIIPTCWVFNDNTTTTTTTTRKHDDEKERNIVVVVSVTNIWQDASITFKFDWNK